MTPNITIVIRSKNCTDSGTVVNSTSLGSSWSSSTTLYSGEIQPAIVGLAKYGSTNLVAVFAKYGSGEFNYKTYTGVWSGISSTSGAGLSTNTLKTNAFSTTSNGTCAWVGYVPNNSGGSLKSAIFCGTFTFLTTPITGTNLQPTISAIGNNIHLLYVRSNEIFRIINSNGTKWGPEDNPFGAILSESFPHAEKYGNMAHHVPIVWKEGTSSPFAVKFGITNIQWEFDNQHQVNAVNSDKQIESTLAVSLLNQKILVDGFIDGSHCKIYRSSDVGATWTDVTPGTIGNGGDPAVTVAKNGTFYYTCLNIFNQTTGDIILLKSTTNGSSWTTYPNPIIPVSHVGSTDKEWIVADQSNNMTTQNNVYVCWDNQTSNNQIMFKRIQPPDSGPAQILSKGDLSNNYVNGCTIAVGPQGQVFVAWIKFNGPTTGQIDLARNYNAGKIGNWINGTAGNFNRFNDGCYPLGCMPGYNNAPVLVTNYPSIAVNSTGALHVVYASNNTNNKGDILYTMSNNCKTSHLSTDPCTFTNPMTINRDGTPTDKFSPILSISSTTNPQILHVMAMDKRDDNPQNWYWKPWDYHCHLDTDCTNPVNWYNTKISDSASTDYDFITGKIGEYDGLVSSIFREVIATWTDHRSPTPASNYNIWSDKSRS